MTSKSAPTIGDILSARLNWERVDPRLVLMAEQDNQAAEIARSLKEVFRELGEQLGLTVVHFGIKKPSRTGMIKVVVSEQPGINLHPRSPEFRQFVKIVWPYKLWLAWVAVERLPKRKRKKGHNGT